MLGTNGAGKTSTMELLEGLAPPAQGAVRVLRCDPCRERALVRRRMGIMLQEGGFPPDLTVAETGRMWAGTLSAPRPVAEALGLVSLGHRAGVAVRSLSGGERRRLDLAMAILGRPEVGTGARLSAHEIALRLTWRLLAAWPLARPHRGLVSVLVSFTPVCSRSPTAARSEAGQVTDGGGSRRTLANLVGKRVGGNPSGVRISYPPPPLTRQYTRPRHASGLACEAAQSHL